MRSKRKLDWIINSFKQGLKFYKKGRPGVHIKETHGNYVMKWDELKIVYTKQFGEYVLITYGTRF